MFSHLLNMHYANIRYSFRHPVVRKGGFAALLSLFVLALVVVFAWYPSMIKHNETEQSVSQLRNKLISLNRLGEFEQVYDVMAETLQNVDKKLNSSTSLAEFTRTLYSLANKNNVKIVSKTSRDSQLKGGYKILYQELTLQGRYKSIRLFISSLRNMPSWTLIKDARLKRKKGSDELIGDFVLVSYTKQK